MTSCRPLRLLLLAIALLLLGGAPLWAADAATAHGGGAAGWRGPGFYLSGPKVLTCLLLFALWARIVDWINRDNQKLHLRQVRWTAIAFGAFLASALVCWLLPWFWLGVMLLLAADAAPLAGYLLYRKSQLADGNVEALESLLDLCGRIAADVVCIAGVIALRIVAYPVAVAVTGGAGSGPATFLIALLLATLFLTLAVSLFHDSLSGLVADFIGRLLSRDSPDPNVAGAPVSVFARGGKDLDVNGARLVAARQSPGLPAAREILADGLTRRAAAIMLDFAQTTVSVRYLIDGVWLPQEGRDREGADSALHTLKLLCGLNPQDRQSRQEGQFGVEFAILRQEVFAKVDRARADFKEKVTVELLRRRAADKAAKPADWEQRLKTEVEQRTRDKFASLVGPWTPVDRSRLPKLPGIDQLNPAVSLDKLKYPATMAAQGTKTGERVLIQFEMQAVHLKTLSDLGMREKMQEQFTELLRRPKGFLLFAAPPAGGLRTTVDVVLRGLDRFLRECVAVEEESSRGREVENVAVTTYKAADGESPASVLTKLFRTEPNVVLVRDLPDAGTVALICSEVAQQERLVMASIRANDCAEALLRVLMLKAPPAEVAGGVTAVLCQRLVRKLCDRCKEAYAPPSQVLRQLGIPEGRVRAFYRPYQPKPEDKTEVCRECGGLGYKGQTAIFELLVLDPDVGRVLATTPKLDLLRQAARQAGMKSLQEEGVLLVARGVTSLPELMRVMK